jgi:uncharacterized membrane protein
VSIAREPGRGAAAAALIAASLLLPPLAHLARYREHWLVPSLLLGALQCAALAFAAAGLGRAGLLAAPAALAAYAALAGFAAAGSVTLAAALSHAAIYGTVLWLFGTSLLPGRTPLVTRLARRTEPVMTPRIAAYTRGVTVLWAGFGALQLLASAILLLAGATRAWSLLVNVLDLPLVAATFALEYAWRRWHLRGERLATLRETALAFTRRHRVP